MWAGAALVLGGWRVRPRPDRRRRRRGLAVLAMLVPLVVSGCSGRARPHGAPATSAPATATPSPTATTPAPAPTWPLTGRPRVGPLTKTVFVKVDNVAGALPQAGVDVADLVVEEPVEGGLTRLFCVFQSRMPPVVGPVRSARPEDATYANLVGAGTLVYSGSSRGEQAGLSTRIREPLWAQEAGRPGFFRGPGWAPHNLYIRTAQVRAAAGSTPVFGFGPVAAGARPARQWSGLVNAVPVSWTWNGRVWLRAQSGSADRTRSGVQVFAQDVVVLHTTVVATGLRDVAGHATPEPVLTGRGAVEVYRDGRVLPGHWTRAGDGPLVLTTPSGGPLLLAPGTVWLEIAPARPLSG